MQKDKYSPHTPPRPYRVAAKLIAHKKRPAEAGLAAKHGLT
jgi:hypothetical protein